MPAQKLPDNETLKKLVYQDGLSNVLIAKAYNVSPQAVNERLRKIGIQRKPWLNTAKAILEAAWPSDNEFKRSDYTHFGVAKELVAFIRWRLGDTGLSKTQLHLAKRFSAYCAEHGTVLSLDLSQENPWVWLPRQESDGQLVVRWPEGREKPKGPHLKAITLPSEPSSAESGRYRW